MPPLPAWLHAHLEAHHAVTSRRELLARATPHELAVWMRAGRLEPVARGVLRVPGSPPTFAQRVRIAVLRAGRDAAANSWASARLLDLELPATLVRDHTDPPGVVIPESRRVTGVEFSVRRTDLPAKDRTQVTGIPCLSATRALIDLAPLVPERTLRVALDSARRQRLASLRWLQRRADDLSNHPGAARLRRVLAQPAVPAESEGERVLAPLVAGIVPAPEWGVADLVPGRRFDLAWREFLVALEYDGRDHHVLPTDRDADGMRDLESVAHGVIVIRVTHGMVTNAWGETRARILRVVEARQRAMTALRPGAPESS